MDKINELPGGAETESEPPDGSTCSPAGSQSTGNPGVTSQGGASQAFFPEILSVRVLPILPDLAVSIPC